MHTLRPVKATALYPSLVLDWHGTPAEVLTYVNVYGKVSFTVDRLGVEYVVKPAASDVFNVRVCGDCRADHDDNHAEAHLAFEEMNHEGVWFIP